MARPEPSSDVYGCPLGNGRFLFVIDGWHGISCKNCLRTMKAGDLAVYFVPRNALDSAATICCDCAKGEILNYVW